MKALDYDEQAIGKGTIIHLSICGMFCFLFALWSERSP